MGVPTDQIEDLAENSAVCVPTMMPYITAFFMPRAKGDRPDVIPGVRRHRIHGSSLRLQETLYSLQNILFVPQWKLYTDLWA